jgi:predicted lipoprotein with Yx(FWY)xxD motif
LTLLLVAGMLALAGCGGDGEEAAAPPPERTAEPTVEQETPEPRVDAPPAQERDGTRVRVGDSEFGTMLFGADGQAIYIFERDPKGRSACYGDCAQAWPPVFTDGPPVAGLGVKAGLLGTVKRRDGRRQVSYAGKPLYFYAHEGPGEVRCHNVDLNGGFWWVVAPDGERRA